MAEPQPGNRKASAVRLWRTANWTGRRGRDELHDPVSLQAALRGWGAVPRSVCREVADKSQPYAIALTVLAANYKREQGNDPALLFAVRFRHHFRWSVGLDVHSCKLPLNEHQHVCSVKA